MKPSHDLNPSPLACAMLLSCAAMSCLPASAQDDFFSSIEIDAPRASEDRDYSVIGWLTEKVSYGLQSPGPLFSREDSDLNKVETSLFVQLDTKLGENFNLRLSGKAYHDLIYDMNDDIDYSDAERNEFRTRFEVRDFYLERKFDNGVYLKLGNQILAWGQSDYLRVTDLINIENQFTFAQQDLEDIRLQVPAILSSVSVNDWTVEGVLTYQAGRNNTAPEYAEFDQLIKLRDSSLLFNREDPDNQSEVFVRASSHYSSGDIEFVAGEFNDNALSVDEITDIGSQNPVVHLSQNRMRALGASANWAKGSWLVFGELGMHFDKAVRPNSDSWFQEMNGWDQKDQLLTVFGVEYNGFRNLLLTFEANNVHTNEHDEFMQFEQNQTSFGGRLYWTAMNERLKLIAVLNDLTDDASQFARVSVDYSWTDNLELGMLWVGYESEEDAIFYDYRNNDVVQLQLRYSFQY